jgi:serine/threonine protein kinase
LQDDDSIVSSGKHYLGKYRLLAELGHGGMADVYLALVEGPAGLGFAKLAVIKRLRANLVEDPEFVTMLIDEARITARLNHPNVVQMLEVGHVDDEYFLAMEYLDGQPLHRLERRTAKLNQKLPQRVQLAVLNEVLLGLHHAHELADYDGTPLEIVHRDITPQNIFVTYEGQVKVMDFGIAKAAGRAQETKHGIVKGKTRFMAPEQAMGIRVDRRVDIFAVGILLWQAATGRKFWSDLDDLRIVEALISGRYQSSPRAASPDVPEELDRICQRALERDPSRRYATALEMQKDLEAFLGHDALTARRELTSIVTEQFAKERNQLRGIIAEAGKDNPSTPSLMMLRSGAPPSGSSGVSSSSSIEGLTHSVPPNNGGNYTAPMTFPPRPGLSDVQVITISSPPPHGATDSAQTPSAALLQLQPHVVVEKSRSRSTTMVAGALGVAALSLIGVFMLSAQDSRQRTGDSATRATRSVSSDFVRLNQTSRAVAAKAPDVVTDLSSSATAAAPPPPPHPAFQGRFTPAPPPPPVAQHVAEPATAAATTSTAPTPPTPPASSGLHPQPRGGQRRLSVDTADPWSASSSSAAGK